MTRTVGRILGVSLLVGVLVAASASGPVLGLGLGVSPGSLEFDARPGERQTRTLHVRNQSETACVFRVYVDDDYADWASASPKEFVLDAGASQAVSVSVKPPLSLRDGHDFLLYIVSSAPGSELRLGAGVKIPVHVSALGGPGLAVLLGGGAAVLLATGGSVAWLRRKKRYAS